jgi:hypothetical protein
MRIYSENYEFGMKSEMKDDSVMRNTKPRKQGNKETREQENKRTREQENKRTREQGNRK